MDLKQAIRAGREKAGSMQQLSDALGKPVIPYGTFETWLYRDRVPPEYTSEPVISRIKAYLKTAL